jgi:hypothetical protein
LKREDCVVFPDGVDKRQVEAYQIVNGKAVNIVLLPFRIDDRWSGVSVSSAAFKNLPRPEQFNRLSFAYLEAAMLCCEHAGEAGASLQWPQAAVCEYLLHHAEELFLKGCILKAGVNTPPTTHDLPKLVATLRKHAPSADVSWVGSEAIGANAVKEALGFLPGNDLDWRPEQKHRYGSDKLGQPPAGISIFTPASRMGQLKWYRKKWEEAWDSIKA